MKKFILLLFILFSLVFSININTCTNISYPGYYTLTNNLDVNLPNASCINISSSNVIFDLNGFHISNSGGSAFLIKQYGIDWSTVKLNNITIENGSVFNTPVFLTVNLTGVYAGIRNLTINRMNVQNGEFLFYNLTDNIDLEEVRITNDTFNNVENMSISSWFGFYVINTSVNNSNVCLQLLSEDRAVLINDTFDNCIDGVILESCNVDIEDTSINAEDTPIEFLSLDHVCFCVENSNIVNSYANGKPMLYLTDGSINSSNYSLCMINNSVVNLDNTNATYFVACNSSINAVNLTSSQHASLFNMEGGNITIINSTFYNDLNVFKGYALQNILIKGNRFESNKIGNLNIFLLISNSTNVSIENNIFEYFNNTIGAGLFTWVLNDSKIVNNTFINNTFGLAISEIGLDVENNTGVNNYIGLIVHNEELTNPYIWTNLEGVSFIRNNNFRYGKIGYCLEYSNASYNNGSDNTISFIIGNRGMSFSHNYDHLYSLNDFIGISGTFGQFELNNSYVENATIGLDLFDFNLCGNSELIDSNDPFPFFEFVSVENMSETDITTFAFIDEHGHISFKPNSMFLDQDMKEPMVSNLTINHSNIGIKSMYFMDELIMYNSYIYNTIEKDLDLGISPPWASFVDLNLENITFVNNKNSYVYVESDDSWNSFEFIFKNLYFSNPTQLNFTFDISDIDQVGLNLNLTNISISNNDVNNTTFNIHTFINTTGLYSLNISSTNESAPNNYTSFENKYIDVLANTNISMSMFWEDSPLEENITWYRHHDNVWEEITPDQFDLNLNYIYKENITPGSLYGLYIPAASNQSNNQSNNNPPEHHETKSTELYVEVLCE